MTGASRRREVGFRLMGRQLRSQDRGAVPRTAPSPSPAVGPRPRRCRGRLLTSHSHGALERPNCRKSFHLSRYVGFSSWQLASISLVFNWLILVYRLPREGHSGNYTCDKNVGVVFCATRCVFEST
jgi:hypothetical protein